MSRYWLPVTSFLCVLALAAACGKDSPSPSAPSATPPTDSEAAADGSTLKATEPTPQSPINNQKPDTPTVVLVAGNSSTPFAGGVPLMYRFEIYNTGGGRVYQSPLVPSGNGTTTHEVVSATLEENQPYDWQVRAEYLGMVGPWSARARFLAPQTRGYIRGNEVYDPLTRGQTVGQRIGPVQFVQNLGAKITWHDARIKYHIPTLTAGEFSMLITNLAYNTKGNKTKIMSMGQGDWDMTTNPRRFTIEKRGDPPGSIAWRVITSSDQIETVGDGVPGGRLKYNFRTDRTYFWRARWGNGTFNLHIKEGGANGVTIYDMTKRYTGTYNPNPHFAYIGAPPGRAGINSGSVNDMIVRQVWLSSRPRPAFANK
jgi:hypothetical protein